MSERMQITMVCSVCGSRNYRTTRTRQTGSKALELKKHCPKCNVHTLHKETK